MPPRLWLVLAGALVTAGCNVGDGAARNEPAAVANKASRTQNAAAPLKAERRPAQASPEEADAAPVKPAAAKRGDVTRDWFAGSWTDTGDCADAGRFERNGTYRLADGTRGMWNVQDSRLVVQNEAGRSALRLRRIDPAIVEIVNEDGSVGRSTRCG